MPMVNTESGRHWLAHPKTQNLASKKINPLSVEEVQKIFKKLLKTV